MNIEKSMAPATTLMDTEPNDDTDHNDNKGIFNAFTAIVDSINKGSELVDNVEKLVDSKFEKMNDQDDNNTINAKLY